MYTRISLYALALFISFSILGPSFVMLLENKGDLEIVQDFDEESSKEEVKDFEEGEKFLNDYHFIPLKHKNYQTLAFSFYQEIPYGHVTDVHSPPPDYIS